VTNSHQSSFHSVHHIFRASYTEALTYFGTTAKVGLPVCWDHPRCEISNYHNKQFNSALSTNLSLAQSNVWGLFERTDIVYQFQSSVCIVNLQRPLWNADWNFPNSIFISSTVHYDGYSWLLMICVISLIYLYIGLCDRYVVFEWVILCSWLIMEGINYGWRNTSLAQRV